MADSANITRRLFLKHAPTVAAVASLPASAAAAPAPLTPSDRIAAAMAEIEAAFAEMYPGWRIQTVNKIVRPKMFHPSGEWEELSPNQHAVCLYVSEEKYGPENFFWSKHCA